MVKQIEQRLNIGSLDVAALLPAVRSARLMCNDDRTRRGGPATYTIPHYPVHLIDVVWMAGANRVIIRPALPQDAELQRDFFRALSAESRYDRFMTPLTELPETLAQRFSNIDYTSHLAILAEVFNGERQT